MANEENIIEFRRITKNSLVSQPVITSLWEFVRERFTRFLGENGAGKSTLMSVLFGMYTPEEGSISVRGEEVKISNPRIATELGIGMVHQHFKLVQNYTVLQNIILGEETLKGPFLDMNTARKEVMELSKKYGLAIEPDELIANITVGQQQRCEILKMLYRRAEILIFDEPTAVLTPQEIDELMQIMKGLANEGHTILFISHKLDEIKLVADRVSVLRRGKLIATLDAANTTKEQMGELMVGKEVSFHVVKEEAVPKEDVLKVENLTIINNETKKKVVNDVSFTVRKGEIVVIAGIDGNGQSELIYGITGLMPINEGRILINGEDLSRKSIRERNMVLSHIPEDRHKYGLVLDYLLSYNLALKIILKKDLSVKQDF